VRECATDQLRLLTEQLGLPWAKKAIIPKVIGMGKDSAYLARLTTLFTINVMTNQLNPLLTYLPSLIHILTHLHATTAFTTPEALCSFPQLHPSSFALPFLPAHYSTVAGAGG